MHAELLILESRKDPSKKGPAALLTGTNTIVPPEFAVVRRIRLDGKLAGFLNKITEGEAHALVSIERATLIAVLGLLGRTAFDAGVEHGKETQDL